ncbi:MAG: VWA domain-containing protein [Acidobacteriaceae bacterium]|nr:VWA domain-containing protein [Acidobacteriaceae bacterium]
MFFLNLTAGEFLALFAGLGGLITALYLLDRAKRKKIVSTLRFWTTAITAEEKQTRRRMRDPWSLILQLASLLLLLLAIAQLQWGTREHAERDHVVLLDTSAWSAAIESDIRVIDREKDLASAYIAALPPHDPVMIVLADALASPVTPFTADRAQLNRALHAATPGWSALNIDQALAYAQQAQNWSGGQTGEIVYAGPKRINSDEIATRSVPNLRILSVPLDAENAGIVRMAVKRSEDAQGDWQATITIRNYGQLRRSVRLNTRFGATVFAPRVLTLAPLQERAAEYVFVTSAAGDLVTHVDSPDALASDNTGTLALPRNGLLRIAVYTARPETIRPLLEANHRVSANFYSPSQYQPNPSADIMLLDEVSPPQAPAIASLWIKPPREHSPLPIKTVAENAVITSWDATSALGTGLHAKDLPLGAAEVFQTFEGDLPVGKVSEGAVVVASPAASGRAQFAVIGFDPFEGALKFQVTTPLLFANLFHWLSPQGLRIPELTAERVGDATLALDPSERGDQLHITTTAGHAVPFTVRDQTLQLFSARPSIVRIASYHRERILSLTLPDVAEHEWKPPIGSLSGLPVRSNWTSASVTIWQRLAVFGGLGLVAEWMLFGARRMVRRKARVSRAAPTARETRERELVSR